MTVPTYSHLVECLRALCDESQSEGATSAKALKRAKRLLQGVPAPGRARLIHDTAPQLHQALESLHAQYGKLHDGLSDMVEGGRLRKSDLPDDYQWVVETLVEGIKTDSKVEKLLGKIRAET